MFKIIKINVTCIFIIILLCLLSAGIALGDQYQGERTIMDMLGRKIEIPEKINRVIGTSPATTLPIYMMAPDKLGAWNFDLREDELPFIPEKYQNLPVIGGWFGKQDGNYEKFISIEPDIILESFTSEGTAEETINKRQEKFASIPLIALDGGQDPLKWPEKIRFIGNILNVPEEAERLVSFFLEALQFVQNKADQVESEKHPRYYYAETDSGLFTEPNSSPRTNLIDLCGGINVAELQLSGHFGRTEVSIEQVILWNPDTIITDSVQFYNQVQNNKKWAGIEAVEKDRIYIVPHGPFSWFDRPNDINQIVGIYWLGMILYSDTIEYTYVEEKVKSFYQDFFHISIDHLTYQDLIGL